MIRRRTIALVAVSAAAFGILPAPARAAVTQLDGTIIPQPSGAAEISVVTSRGFAASADTLSGLFQNFASGVDRGLDPVADASMTPGNFDPTCGLHVSIVLKGDGCQNALGWYNATQPPSAPAASMIYPIVPTNLTGTFPNGIGCTDSDFCPMASRDTTQTPQHAWADPLPAFDPQIASSPNWRGGRVGFVLIGNSGQCSQTKYSEATLNVKSTAFGTPWITALVYPSMAAPGAVYLAFESLPMPASSWTADGCDGDFNDDVFLIAPTPCADGGTADAGSTDAAMLRDGGRDTGATGAGGTTGGAGTTGTGGTTSTGGTKGTGGTTSTGGAMGTGGVSATGGSGGAATGGTGTGGVTSTGGAPGTSGASGTGGTSTSSGGSSGGCGCETGGAPISASGLALASAAILTRRRRRRQT